MKITRFSHTALDVAAGIELDRRGVVVFPADPDCNTIELPQDPRLA